MSQERNARRGLGTVGTAVALAGAAILACPSGSSAAVYYKRSSQSTTTWDALNEWFDQPTAGVTIATAFNGNTFDSQGYDLRTGSGTSTFGDAQTTLILGANRSKGLIVRPTSTSVITVHNLVSDGGQIMSGSNPAHIAVTNLTNSGGLRLRPEDYGGARTLDLDITTLTGSGYLQLYSTTGGGAPGGTVLLSATSATGYTGQISFTGTGAVTLNFDSDFACNGSLVLSSLARVALDQNVSFAGVTIGSDVLSPGTYSYATLRSAYSTTFLDSGSGSLTVIPEPAAGAVVGGVAGLLMLKRRRR